MTYTWRSTGTESLGRLRRYAFLIQMPEGCPVPCAGANIGVLAKIESAESVGNLNSILDAVDGDKTIRNTMADNPMAGFDINPAPPPVPVHDGAHVDALVSEVAVAERAEHVIPAPVVEVGPPSFIPPKVAAAGLPSTRTKPPAFVPPGVVAKSVRRHDYASPYA